MELRLAPFVMVVLLLPGLRGEGQVVRVATFNVENYVEEAGAARPLKSAEARAKVREEILAMKPDVIALEEMGSTNGLLELQTNLKASGLELPYWEFVNGHDTNIHLAVLSRLAIVGRRPHTNETFVLGGKRFFVSRGFLEVELEANPHFQFTLIAVHLKSKVAAVEADEAELRLAETKALRHVVDARIGGHPDEALVVVGDFNDVKDSAAMRTILGRGKTGLFDTRPAERNGDEARRVMWTEYWAKEDLYSRIDYILVNRAMERLWRSDETYVLAATNWGLASDHRPLVAGFKVEAK